MPLYTSHVFCLALYFVYVGLISCLCLYFFANVTWNLSRGAGDDNPVLFYGITALGTGMIYLPSQGAIHLIQKSILYAML